MAAANEDDLEVDAIDLKDPEQPEIEHEHPVKRVLNGLFKSKKSLSVSTPALEDGGNLVEDRGRSKAKESWSKWKKRLSSLHRKPVKHRTEEATKRALPPVPPPPQPVEDPADCDEDFHDVPPEEDVLGDGGQNMPYLPPVIDFATSIEKVKSYGWYWGPISRVASEKLLSDEPDGSFIVRDSSADHYIFSLTFKLDNKCSHVRIENHQGNFSFGSLHNFKSSTIVDFIENAVTYSRSGRYLFFLHRRPRRGPMQVQLLNPVSRFKHVQSLQHMCRFVILKLVPRVLLPQLPVPKRIQKYLDTPFYYSEQVADWTDLEPDRDRRAPPDDTTESQSPPPALEFATATNYTIAQSDDEEET